MCSRYTGENLLLLDTPCAAGARSTSFHPAATTGRQLSQRQKTSVRGKLAKRCRTRADLEEHFFVHILQKKLQTAAEKGSLNRPIPALNFTWEQFTFGSFKIKSSNYQCPAAVKPPPYPPRKNQLFLLWTDGQLYLMCSTDGKSASRNYAGSD